MKRPSHSARRAARTIAIFCYVLIVAAWIVDLLTPQLFVAAILLNGPIALSGLALSRRLTAALVVFAEIANVAAGYVNGIQAHHHWDAVAVGDRVLSAASFLLVGYLTARAQEFAREAGSASERARIASEEKALRRALEAVRSTLNVDLVLRAIAREALNLSNASHALIIARRSGLDLYDVYRLERGSEAELLRSPLDPPMRSILAAASREVRLRERLDGDAVAAMLLDAQHAQAMLSVRIAADEESTVLMLFGDRFRRGAERLLQAFADGASVALAQAWLFMQLGYRNEQIASQKTALEDRARVIRDIVYALAHDLRTPLSAAGATMQQALDGAYGALPGSYREVLLTSLASNADSRRLVETLLMVARFEAGESSVLREDVEISREVLRVVDELRPIAEIKGVGLRARLNGMSAAGPQAGVLGDPSELRRAVSNLVSNAIEASPEGTSVTVRWESGAGSERVIVEDEGYGVPEQQREHLFMRFAPGTRAPGGGTGLGLYIVRLVAEKLGGTVSYEPRMPRGSAFTLSLPRRRE